VHDIVEDRDARRLVMWLKARADTLAGEYVNEYMWTLDFDETGEKIVCMREFVDTIVNREFWPKVAGVLKEIRRKQMEEE
jgi:ketosteroid isomerase-like protein